jgi:pimeloyl-ACP methyl ester carboxylesterase
MTTRNTGQHSQPGRHPRPAGKVDFTIMDAAHNAFSPSADRVMPPEHGRRLAGLLPQGQLAEIEDSYTLIPLDQPARLAQVIRNFTRASGTT